jgi:hypothetical protein
MNARRITTATVLLTVGAIVLGMSAFSAGTQPAAMPTTLSLRSGYSSDGNLGGFEASSLTLSLEQTADGWKGWLTPDPNILSFDRFGQPVLSTLMAGEKTPVTLRLHATNTATGRRCYEVMQDRFTETMHLVFPRNAGGTYRFIVENKAGNKRIVLLEADDADLFVADIRTTH